MSEPNAPAGESAAGKEEVAAKPRIEPIEWERKPRRGWGSWPPRILRTEQPSYIASALCVLLGMYLTASGLEAHAWGRVGLAAIMLTYQGMLIGGSALLLRVHKLRSAILLALLSALFIVDPTLRLEGVVTLERWGFAIAALWGLLSLGGVYGVARVTGTRLNGSAWYAIGSAVLLIAAGPVLIRVPELDRQHVFLSLWWIVGTQLFIANSARSAGSKLATDAGGLLRVDRAIRLIAHLAPLGALAHVIVSMQAFDVIPHPVHLIPLLALAPLRARDEARTWVYAALLMLLMSAEQQTLLPCAALLAVIGTYKGHVLDRPRLYVGAVLCVHLVMGAYGYTGIRWKFVCIEPWMLATSIALLLALAARYRMPSAVVAAAALWHFGKPPGHSITTAQWGGLLLALGFAALIYALVRDVKRATRDLPLKEPR